MLEWFRRGRKRPSRSTPDGDYAQLTVPGYGPPPVTRPNDAGPEPAVYGIPPEVPPIGHQPPRREQRPGRGRNS